MLAFFAFPKGDIKEDDLKDVTAFADGAAVNAPDGALLTAYYGDNVSFNEVKIRNTGENELKSPILTGISGNVGKYLTKGVRAIAHIVKEQVKALK